MKRTLLSFFIAISFSNQLYSQTSCSATSFDVDLSASIDTTVSFQSTRNGDCCTGTNCIRFNLTINPACSFVNFMVANPAPPGNAAYYQVDCGTPTSLGTPICIVGKTNVTITFCKPGNDNPIYTIVAAGALKGSDDITVRQGCTGSISVSGLLQSTINWTSVYPGPAGAYDSYLSCNSGCTSTNVTPLQGSPSYIDYQVSGNRVCGSVVYDTIRVYAAPQIDVVVTPANPAVCSGGSTNVTLTATASGGDAPYNFSWNTGQTGTSITVNSGGTYSVSVTDAKNCLPAVQTATVATTPLPAPPTVSNNSPVCEGASLKLFASAIPGATYSWTGPNGFTSSLQNPVIDNVAAVNAGSYSVTVTTGQCTSSAASTTAIINSVPSSPAASNSSPVCEGGDLNLSVSAIAGAAYNWTGPNGFTSTSPNPVINSIGSANAGMYNVTVTVNGCTSAPSTTAAIVNPLPPAPQVPSNAPLCSGNNLTLFAGSISGASYSWTGPNGFTSTLQNPTIANAGTNASGDYAVRVTVNGCTGPAESTSVSVNPIPPLPVVISNSPLCQGSGLNLTASTVTGASYSWSGPNGFSSSLQNPSITNISTATSGLYSVTTTVNGCTSAAVNTAVTVNPIPATPVIGNNSPLCENSTLSLTTSTIPGASYSWGGPNGFVSTSQNPTIASTTAANSGLYSVTATVNGCTSPVASQNIIVNLIPPMPTASSNSPVCSGKSILLNASTINGATYSWTGPNGFTSSSQNPVISNVSLIQTGVYKVSVSVNGCSSINSAIIPVTVNQTPIAPIVSNNGPLCEGSSLSLTASNVIGANYKWTGPNGFTSTSQNISIANITSVNKGVYYVTATANGCVSPQASTSVVINQPAMSNAGSDQLVCTSNSFVNVAGTISGGSGSGIWTSNGSGTFSPGNTNLTTSYYPSSSDKAAGSVVLSLTSANNGVCPASLSSVRIVFAAQPTANAGNGQTVCANNANIVLNGQFNNAAGAIWSTSGTGSFSPSNSSLNATYIPGASDKTNGSVKLILTTMGNGPCAAATDAMVLTIKTPPVVNGGVKYVVEEGSTVLNAVVNGSNLKYSWTPAIYLNSDTIANPICTPSKDVLYKLIVKDALGCTSSGDIMVKILKHPEIPNVFTPNGDGTNDRWQIKYLAEYPDCTVDIYNRYGQLIYQSVGYTNAWEGTSNGKQVPAGTYYYIINPKNSLKPLSGFVDIVK